MIYDFRSIGLVVLLALMVSFWGCGNSKNKDEKPETEKSTKHDPKKVNSKPDYSGEPLDRDSIEVLKLIYISDTNGAFLYSKPDTNSLKEKIVLPQRKELEAIEESDNWYSILYYIRRNNCEPKYRWEKFYIQKTKASPLNYKTISDSEFYECIKFYDGISKENLYQTNLFYNNFKIEFINPTEYYAETNNKFEPEILDTFSMQKKNYTLEIPVDTGNRIFYDNYMEGGSMQIHHYEGYLPEINQFYIFVQHYEAGQAFLLIDKSTGKETRFRGEPLVFPDHKNLLALYFHPYGELPGNIEYFKFENGVFKQILGANLVHWTPALDEKPFISKNGSLYSRIQFAPNVYKSDLSVNKNYFFIKISLRK
ncbi:MAG: hypothetical protein JXR53_12080 [Bacteroidales bacterium]|nr:hypothetical protein [Bacteroidales bacterium]